MQIRALSHPLIRLFALGVTLAVLMALPACSQEQAEAPESDRTEDRRTAVKPDWDALADSLQIRTRVEFWDEGNEVYRADNAGGDEFHYWWNAHALDVLIDGYARTGDSIYVDRMQALVDGIRANNGGAWENEYYDDMEWLALAALRAYDLSDDDRFLQISRTLWHDIQTGWNDDQGGGIAWRKSQMDYKNTPANAPAVILAARLYQRSNDQDDLDWARRIYTWLNDHLVDRSSGLVWDGVNREGDGAIDKDWIFTYNQGVYIGAALELFNATEEQSYLEDAVQTADYVIESSKLAPDGILADEGTGDGGLFKGILVRYLTQLARSDALSEERRSTYRQFLIDNAQMLHEQGIRRPSMLIGPDWQEPPGSRTDLSAHLSGVMLVEAAARLDDG